MVQQEHPVPHKFVAVSWTEIEELCISVAEKIRKAGIKVDVIIGVLRGGWIPARLLSDYLGVERMGAIGVKFYRGVGEAGERPIVTQPLVLDIRDLNVLVVDDVADTGKTLNTVTNFLTLYGPKHIYTATLYVKPWSIVTPDFYAAITDAWIIFPWDKAETFEELVNLRGFSIEEVSRISGESVEKIKRLLRTRRR